MILCPIAHWQKHRPDAFAFPGLTYRQFEILIQKVCLCLVKTPESIISFAPEKTPLDIALFFSAWRLGKAVYPLNFRLPLPVIKERIKKTKSAWIEPAKLFLSQTLAISELNPSALSTLLETSSASKIVCHTLENHFASAKSTCQALHLTKASSYCLNLPLFHVAGIATFLRTFLMGAQIVFPKEKIRATHISMVPTQLYRYLQNPYPLPNLQCLLLGGAPLPEKLVKQASHLPLCNSYGMTETASMIIANNQILTHTELKLGSDEEIFVRGPSLFSHYWGEEERTKSDWFATKDLGKIHSNGKIEILGRKDRQFISGGENIQPEEIEKALIQLPNIIEAHVFPYPDSEFGMRPKAVVYAEKTLTPAELIAKLKEQFPTYKVPTQIKIQTTPFASKLTKMSQY